MDRNAVRISACYIVKDEEANIVRSLASIRDGVDEVIVVDTGSTDGTVKAIETDGRSRLHHFRWCDDFAAARNYALERASGDWVLFLDADEYLTEETKGHLRSTIETYRAHDGLLFPMVHVDEDGSILGEDVVLRAFRKTPETRYRGRIHEEPFKGGQPLQNLRTLRKDELCLYHTGYAASVSRRKAERNVRLLLEEMARDDEKTHYYHYLADAYYGLDDAVEAVRYARLDVELGPQPRTNPASSYRILLHYAGSAIEKRAILERAMRDYPGEASFHADFAETAAYLLNFSHAVQAMERAISLYEEQGGMPRELHSLAKVHILQWKSILARAKSIRISACCIVKDEEKDLPRWLEQTAVYADERVVVDTGSTDGTPALLQGEKKTAADPQSSRPGINVYEIEWKDDFAAAKNFAIEGAAGDWIVFLDADEYMDAPELVRPYIAMMSLKDAPPEVIQLPIINIDEDRENKELHRFSGIRIFRRKDSIRYAGRIHENLQKAEGDMSLYRERDRLAVLHVGYSTGRMQRKLKRNFDILQKEIAEVGEEPRHWRYLSDCFYGFGEYDKALHYALKVLMEGEGSIGAGSDMYRQAIASMHKLGYPLEEIQGLVETAILAYPDLPDFYGELGIILKQRGRKEEALSALRRALSVAEATTSKEASEFASQKPMLLAVMEELQSESEESEPEKMTGVATPSEISEASEETAPEERKEKETVHMENAAKLSKETGARIALLVQQLFVVLAERIVRGERLYDMQAELRFLPENMRAVLRCVEESALPEEYRADYNIPAKLVEQMGSPALKERYQMLGGEENA